MSLWRHSHPNHNNKYHKQNRKSHKEARRGPPWCNRTLIKVLGFQWKIGPALAKRRSRDMKDQQKSSHEDKIPRSFKAKYAGWFLESRKRQFETGRRSASEGVARWNNEEKGTEHWKKAVTSQKTIREHRYIIWRHHFETLPTNVCQTR